MVSYSIKQIIAKKKPDHHFSNMKDSSGICSDPLQIATKFNDFFANIGRSLASKVDPPLNFLIKIFLLVSTLPIVSFSILLLFLRFFLLSFL